MAEIPLSEITFSKLSLVDDIGRVFTWRGAIYRGIPASSADAVRELMASGLIQRLIAKRLIPNTVLSEYTVQGYEFILAHETAPYVSYPTEWSFSMYRDAANLVLDVIEIAQEFGYILKDSHPYNVVFFGVTPLYVDIGSLVKCEDAHSLVPVDFKSWYYYPLSIWSSGDTFLANRIISDSHQCMPEHSYQRYLAGGKQPRRLAFPKLGLKIRDKCRRIISDPAHLLRGSQHENEPTIPTKKIIANAEREVSQWRNKIRNLTAPQVISQWNDYHDEYMAEHEIDSTPRFDRLVELVNQLDATTATEIAGNQGIFSLQLLKRTKIESIVCTDADAQAVDKLYQYCRRTSDRNSKTVSPCIVDFMVPEVNYFTSLPSERFRADIVFALAVTHHLLLSNRFRIHDILDVISRYSKRYAFIEFMPLGLWNGVQAAPTPDWYTEAWFREAFEQHFKLIHHEQIETNRILFVGQKYLDDVCGGEKYSKPNQKSLV
jgi:hypothetical protein